MSKYIKNYILMSFYFGKRIETIGGIKMYLYSGNRAECFGCEACVQICPKQAIDMSEDGEGFRYPHINKEVCIGCGACKNVCPYENEPQTATDDKYVWGGYHLDEELRFNSTSGGAFSAIAEAFCDENYVIFGAEAKGLCVRHAYITDISEIHRFQKSKYSQSMIGSSFKKCRKFLMERKKVLFSGTPCQIAALKNFLTGVAQNNLLTVEVICEGVPSSLYMRKYEKHLKKKYGCRICELDYRYTGKVPFSSGKWDFQMERTIIGGYREMGFRNDEDRADE